MPITEELYLECSIDEIIELWSLSDDDGRRELDQLSTKFPLIEAKTSKPRRRKKDLTSIEKSHKLSTLKAQRKLKKLRKRLDKITKERAKLEKSVAKTEKELTESKDPEAQQELETNLYRGMITFNQWMKSEADEMESKGPRAVLLAVNDIEKAELVADALYKELGLPAWIERVNQVDGEYGIWVSLSSLSGDALQDLEKPIKDLLKKAKVTAE